MGISGGSKLGVLLEQINLKGGHRMADNTKTKKRGNGEGTVFFNRSKGLWVAQYVVNQKRKTLYAKTKTEVRAKLVKAQNSINEGSYIDPHKTTVEEWLRLWLKTYVIGKKAPKTAT